MRLAPVLFIPHGGGPMPLFDDSSHREMIAFLRRVPALLGNPAALIVISAHWEEHSVTITSGAAPALIYDYYGFPEAAYRVSYPVLGNSELARQVCERLQSAAITAKLDAQRGFDHGLFVPLKLIYPDAKIPCVQISLLQSLDAKAHLAIGKALAPLRQQNVAVIGSGFSFHNLRAMLTASAEPDVRNDAFQQWLIDTCTGAQWSQEQRESRLLAWEGAPFAHYCHPRAEHLLPLHVCAGLSGGPAELVFAGEVLGKKAVAFLW